MGVFRRGIGTPEPKQKQMWENMNVTNVARLGVVSKC